MKFTKGKLFKRLYIALKYLFIVLSVINIWVVHNNARKMVNKTVYKLPNRPAMDQMLRLHLLNTAMSCLFTIVLPLYIQDENMMSIIASPVVSMLGVLFWRVRQSIDLLDIFLGVHSIVGFTFATMLFIKGGYHLL